MNQQEEFKRIHDKLDSIDEKLTSHLERIAKVESEAGWVKLGMLAVIGWITSTFFIGK